ncbi:hypothetical protein Hanom_Chr17g01558701 [Helianthus anomalus]
MIEKYRGYKKELEFTQISYENWVESCAIFEILLNQQTKTNVKFVIEFSKSYNQSSKDNIHFDPNIIEVIPTNSSGKEIRITEPNGKKTILKNIKVLIKF